MDEVRIQRYEGLHWIGPDGEREDHGAVLPERRIMLTEALDERPEWARLPPDERYRRDPTFAALVDHFYALLRKAQVTPTEIREAAMLAQIMYEEHAARRISRDPSEWRDR